MTAQCCCITIFFLFLVASAGQGNEGMRQVDRGLFLESEPLCGVYSLAATLKVLQVDFELGEIVDSRYVAGKHGSTIENICDAARSTGVHARPVRGLSFEYLRSSHTPVILHLNRSRSQRTSQHWVAFLGEINRQAVIFDPSQGTELVSYADILSEWDGVGVLISATPTVSNKIYFLEKLRGRFWIGIAFVLLVGLKFFVGENLIQKPSWKAKLVVISFFVACISLLSHSVPLTGFFKNPSAVASVTKFHRAAFLPTIEAKQLAAMIDDQSVDIAIVDARPRSAYLASRVPGAISVPVGQGPAEYARIVNQLQDKECVVVYCQSERCNWDEEVAAHLIFSGIECVQILRGGMIEWRKFERGTVVHQ